MAFTMEELDCLRDGQHIRGHFFRGTDTPRPAVILCHAFLADERMCCGYAALLAGRGYTAVTFDFCGGGPDSKSDGRSEDMTLFTELADLKAVYDHVRSLPFVEENRVSLLGCSQGGLVAAMAARTLELPPEKLILLYPALCIPDDARAGRMLSFRFDPANIPEILGTVPMKLGGEYARSVLNMDVFAEIGGYDGPVLFLQGTADRVVPLSYPRKAAELYSDCRYHEISGGTHCFTGDADAEACRLIAEFMGKIRKDARS